MKRFIIFSVIVLSTLWATAQNANRSGVFVEVGSGVIIGGFKYMEEEPFPWKNIEEKKLSGLSINADLGYRLSLSRYWALELKCKFECSPSQGILSEYGPMIGVRYTTTDFSNMSLYLSVNIGEIYDMGDGLYYYRGPYHSHYGDDWGFIYELGAGINFTSHFYGGLNWSARKYHNSLPHFGSLGIKLGYRF